MDDSLTAQFKLNLPIGLKNELQEQATNYNRSLTGEIVARLEESLRRFKADSDGNVEVSLSQRESDLLVRTEKNAGKIVEIEGRHNKLMDTLKNFRPDLFAAVVEETNKEAERDA